MKNLRCRPFSFEEGVAADGLKNVKWLVVEYDEKDRDAGAGFVEEFLDSIGKEKWESLEAVLWRSGEGEGDVWKRFVCSFFSFLLLRSDALLRLTNVGCFAFPEQHDPSS